MSGELHSKEADDDFLQTEEGEELFRPRERRGGSGPGGVAELRSEKLREQAVPLPTPLQYIRIFLYKGYAISAFYFSTSNREE